MPLPLQAVLSNRRWLQPPSNIPLRVEKKKTIIPLRIVESELIMDRTVVLPVNRFFFCFVFGVQLTYIRIEYNYEIMNVL